MMSTNFDWFNTFILNEQPPQDGVVVAAFRDSDAVAVFEGQPEVWGKMFGGMLVPLAAVFECDRLVSFFGSDSNTLSIMETQFKCAMSTLELWVFNGDTQCWDAGVEGPLDFGSTVGMGQVLGSQVGMTTHMPQLEHIFGLPGEWFGSNKNDSNVLEVKSAVLAVVSSHDLEVSGGLVAQSVPDADSLIVASKQVADTPEVKAATAAWWNNFDEKAEQWT